MFCGENAFAFYNIASAQEGSKEWLEKYGLEAQGVGREKVFCALGRCRAKKSRHAAYRDLQSVERRLLHVVSKLQARLEWLDSGSRRVLGRVSERSAVLLLCAVDGELALVRQLINAASCLLLEQFSTMKCFNVMGCIGSMYTWKNAVVEATADHVRSAMEWVEHLPLLPNSEAPRSTMLEGVAAALKDEQAESVYMLVCGRMCLHDYSKLCEQLKASPRPLHILLCGHFSAAALSEYQQLATASGGRCHSYRPGLASFDESFTFPCSTYGDMAAQHLGTTQMGCKMASTSSETQLICKELETARNLLAETQTLQLEASLDCFAGSDSDEPYISSEEWLMVHGMQSNRLMFQDLVSSLAFNHCGSVPQASSSQQAMELLPHRSVSYTRYCRDFVHLREGDHVIHVQLSDKTFQQYKHQVDDVIRKCRERLEWLIAGSRALFGTILEQRVVLALDTSSSMASRLDFVKDRVRRLLQEQLSHTEAFTVVQFSSSVSPWRERLVPSNRSNLVGAWHWVRGLEAHGTTNTLGALLACLRIPGVQAVYLLTDGRPDQPVEVVLAKVQQLALGVAVNTISFDCLDSRTVSFLKELARLTGGRYHCFRGGGLEGEDPADCESEDIRVVRDEVMVAQQEIDRAQQLLVQSRKLCERGRSVYPALPSRVQRTTHKTNFRCFLSSERWLTSNSLIAMKLTPMDIYSLGQSTVLPASTVSSAVEADGLTLPSPTHQQSSPTSPTHQQLSPTSPAHQQSSPTSPTHQQSSPKSPTHQQSSPTSPTHQHSSTPLAYQNIPLATPSSTYGHASSPLPPPPPQGDLEGYKKQLERQMEVYWKRLSCMAWLSLSPKARVGVRNAIPQGKASYQHNRDLLHRALSEANWPCPLQNFLLLEEQISQAQTYLEWCEAHIREKSVSPSLTVHTSTRSRTPRTNCSSPLDSIGLPSGSISHDATRGLKGQVVIARSDVDGLYYSSLVMDYVRTQHVSVQFADGRHQRTSSHHVFPVTASCHTPLQPGDCVLVGMGTSAAAMRAIHRDTQVLYVPGIVESVELRGDAPRNVANCRVNTFGCHGAVSRPRKQLVKIPHSCYAAACRSMVKVLGRRTQEGALDGRKCSRSWHGNGLLEHWKNVHVEDKGRKEMGTVWSYKLSQDELSSEQVKEAFKTSAGEDCVKLKESTVKHCLGVQQSKTELSELKDQSEGPLSVQEGPQEEQEGTQEEQEGPQEEQEGPQEEQEGPQEEQEGPQEGPQEEQEGPQEGPQEEQEGPQEEQEGPQEEQEGPQEEQEGPQEEQEGPQEEQEGPHKEQEGPQEEQEGPQEEQEGPHKEQDGPQEDRLQNTVLVGKTLDNKIIDEVWAGPSLLKATSPQLSLQSTEREMNVSGLEKQLGEGMLQVGTHLEQLEGQVSGLLTRQVKLDEVLAKLVSRDEDLQATMAGWKDAFLASHVKEVSDIDVHVLTAAQAVMAVAEVRDQSVNTEPPKEDRVVGTDPMTESRGVGTEWHDFVNSTPACQQGARQQEQGTGCQTSHHVLPVVVGMGTGERSQACGSFGSHGGGDGMVPVHGTNKSSKAKKIRIRSSIGVPCGTRECEMVPVEEPDKGEVLASDGGCHQVDKGVGDEWMEGRRHGNDDRAGVNKVGSGQTSAQKDGSSKLVVVKGKDSDVNTVVKGMVVDDMGGGTIDSAHGNAGLSKGTAHFDWCAPHVEEEEAQSCGSGSLAKASQNEHNGGVVAVEMEPPGAAGQQADTCPGVVGPPPSKLDATEDTAPDSHRTQPPCGLAAVGQMVLARWPDRGWYHYACVLRSEEEGSWYLLEREADTETIHRSDIVLPNTSSYFKVQDTVLGCHPRYEGCYVPAHVTGVDEQQVTVRLYDNTVVCCSKQDVHPLSLQKHQEVLRCIVEKEHSLVGKAVIARRDSDGLFYPGKVLRHMAFPQVYLIGWKNGNTQAQSGSHLFGPMTKRHVLREGDYVLALASPSYGMCMPGQVVGSHKGQLEVEFCDGQNQLVEPTHCFRILKKYYEAAVEHIALKAEDELDNFRATEGNTTKGLHCDY